MLKIEVTGQAVNLEMEGTDDTLRNEAAEALAGVCLKIADGDPAVACMEVLHLVRHASEFISMQSYEPAKAYNFKIIKGFTDGTRQVSYAMTKEEADQAFDDEAPGLASVHIMQKDRGFLA